jgi:twinkle protein
MGVKSAGLPFFNRRVKGLRAGELTILSGGTGCGKTTLLSQLSMDFCRQGVRTLWGSFELSNENLLMTMLQQFSQKNLVRQKELFDHYAQQFEKLPFYFLSFFGSTDPDKVLATIRYAVEKLDINLIVLDTLQFMLSGQAEGFRKF